ISAAPASLAAAISSVEQEEYETIGFLNNFVASFVHMQSVSSQCQGSECQGSGAEVTAASADEPPSANQISILIREFVHPFQQGVPSASIDAVQDTPAIEMIYEYLNAQPTLLASSAAVDAASSPSPSLVNRVEAEELSETAVAPRWWFAHAAATSSAPYAPAATLQASNVVDEVDDSNASVQSKSFDFDSWGKRIDNAALRLASNIDGIIVDFMPSVATVQAIPSIEIEDALEDMAAAATTAAPF
ncbi:hypothetical protein IWW38_005655, partial [Coemansia aciculifera]